MIKFRQKKRLVSEINMVPYIDVMLVLLVIFMVTAPLIYQGVEVNLPKADARSIKIKNEEPLIVTVNKTGSYFLNVESMPNSPILAKQLSLRVAAELKRNPQRKVMVKADKGAVYGEVVSAMVLLQRSGADTVGLITDQVNKT